MNEKVLITGGAGFIGANYARRLISQGYQVSIFDNLSRKGADSNLAWIEETTGKNSFEFIKGDIRDLDTLIKVTLGKEIIIHLAAQVAVTTSVIDPRTDFEINALGTFNVLEAAKENGKQPIVIYASTNKVYGELTELDVIEKNTRYEFKQKPFGVSEEQCLDFHSPYGCSKGAGDQYVRDYYRLYEIPSIVFRQSCIYGPRQFGIEDQGWVAWFVIAAQNEMPINIYGDGKQVRDLLYVEDLLDAYDTAILNIEKARGNVFNIGGGKQNAVSIWIEFSRILEKSTNKQLNVDFEDWRPGDQKIYISDIRMIEKEIGWHPRTSVEDGVQSLANWVAENNQLFA